MKSVKFSRVFMVVMCIVLVSSCSDKSIGTKAAIEYCECMSKLEKVSTPDGKIPFSVDNLASLGCLGEFTKKYEKYFVFEEKNVNKNIKLKENIKFKDPQHQKDFETAVKECLKSGMEK